MRILFVDDDPNVLDGIRRALHPMRERWDMSFAGSGAAGLEALERTPHEVVVADAHMPGMDGAELLRQVKALYPQTARIVLSGSVSDELAIRTVGVAHQYLTKPCSATELIEVLGRTEATSGLLRDARLLAAVTRTGELPSAPVLYTALKREVNRPDGSVDRIGRIVSEDPAMAAQVLRLVNSSFFGIRRTITHPSEAVSFLGLDTLTALVLSAHVFRQIDPSVAVWLDLDGLWKHGVATGRLARAIMETERPGKATADLALSAGLLHDAGRPVLAMNFPERYRAALDRAKKRDGVDLSLAERDELGADHGEVGAYLLDLWGLPGAITEAVSCHHHPGRCAHREFGPLTAVHAACALSREQTGSAAGSGAMVTTNLDLAYLGDLGVADHVAEWRRIATGIREEAGSLAGGGLGRP